MFNAKGAEAAKEKPESANERDTPRSFTDSSIIFITFKSFMVKWIFFAAC